MKRTRFGWLLVVLMLVTGFTGCGKSEQNTKVAGTAAVAQTAESDKAQAAYPFALKTMAGKSISLQDYKGKVLIVNVWDTWCPPCQAEIPDFIDLYDTYQKKGLEILGVAGGRNGEKAVMDFVAQYGINYPIALLTQEFLDGFGGINAIPTTFLIDKKGNLVKTYVGYREKEVFVQDLTKLL